MPDRVALRGASWCPVELDEAGRSRLTDGFMDPLLETQPTVYTLRPGAGLGDASAPVVPDSMLADIVAAVAVSARHTFEWSTTQIERVSALFSDAAFIRDVTSSGGKLMGAAYPGEVSWPLPNLRLGVPVVDQESADSRIPVLLNTPAAERYVDATALSGPIDMSGPLDASGWHRPRLTYWLTGRPYFDDEGYLAVGPHLDQVHLSAAPDRTSAWSAAIATHCLTADVPVVLR